MTTAERGCAMCTYLEEGPPGGWLFEDRHWVVGVFPGFEVPGWVFLVLRRHAEGVVALTDEELATVGPTIARLSRAIYSVTDAERVYYAAFGERFPHYHGLLMARSPDVAPEHRGDALQAHASVYRNADEALATAARLKQALA
jgi:diadenosine tetraphosphate (Ap4A) HIT family hydrolase